MLLVPTAFRIFSQESAVPSTASASVQLEVSANPEQQGEPGKPGAPERELREAADVEMGGQLPSPGKRAREEAPPAAGPAAAAPSEPSTPSERALFVQAREGLFAAEEEAAAKATEAAAASTGVSTPDRAETPARRVTTKISPDRMPRRERIADINEFGRVRSVKGDFVESKRLVELLRHHAKRKGYAIRPDGFVSIEDALAHLRAEAALSRKPGRQGAHL
jgi:hypothetical protein